MSLWGRKPFLTVRILGPDGYYPRFSLRSSTHRYEASDGLVWTAAIQQPLPEDWETSESPTLVPEEIRLHASLALSEGDPWHGGMPTVTVGSERWEEDIDDDFELESDAATARIHTALSELRQ